MLRVLFAAFLGLFIGLAHASDYTYPDAPLNVSVRYGFNDTVSFTPAVSGTYDVDVVPSNVYGGCATRYCHSKWSIVTTMTAEYIGNMSLQPNGNASIPLVGGSTYVLHLSGVGTGTGLYAGYGAYKVSFALSTASAH